MDIYVCVYLEAAVATVFEIATFPLAKVLHSRSITNVFFQFLKEKKNLEILFWKKPPKMVIFPLLGITFHLIDLHMIFRSSNMFSGWKIE